MTDASHNFEFGGTGGNDPVLAEADDSSGFNNANMATDLEGISPRMQMFLFTNPGVNSGDDAAVVYHEYTHGLTNRLVGNGAAFGLLSKQSRAMGEGWGDWYAMDFLVQEGHVTDTAADGEVVAGEYVTNNVNTGIRRNAIDCSVGSVNATKCPGRISGTINPGPGGFSFNDMGKIGSYGTAPGSDDYVRFQVHDDGEIWSETLWDLRTAIGASDARALITNAMRLSPLAPSFLDMRDAILAADQVAGGAHHDQIWTVFAQRGMGFGAGPRSAGATRGKASSSLRASPERVSHRSPTRRLWATATTSPSRGRPPVCGWR